MSQKLIPFFIFIFSAWFAQFLKVFYFKFKTKKWNWKAIFISGGMPSSHTAGFSALSTSIFLMEGYTTGFTIALSVLFLVMYDAINIRWFGGIASQKITNLTEQLWKKELITINKVLKQPLKTILGHKVSEVITGLLVGIIFAYTIHKFI